MSYVSKIQKPAAFSPFVLRIAVAGVLAYCGLQTFRATNPMDESTALTDTVSAQLATADQSVELSNPVEGGAPDVAAQDVANEELSASRVLGFGEMCFAALLSVGLMVRFMSLAGLGAVVTAALGASGFFADQKHVGILADIFNSGPATALLFGAICLGLLFSGAGLFSLDRVLKGRRHRQPDETMIA